MRRAIAILCLVLAGCVHARAGVPEELVERGRYRQSWGAILAVTGIATACVGSSVIGYDAKTDGGLPSMGGVSVLAFGAVQAILGAYLIHAGNLEVRTSTSAR